MTALALVSETIAETALREASPADAPDLALALAREINRQIRSLVDTVDSEESADPFALATRGRDEEQRRKRMLLGGLNALKAAHARYMAVFEAWQVACSELADASELACQATGVQMPEIARSLGLTIKSTPSNAPISDMARERKERDAAKRAIDAQILEAKQAAKAEIDAARALRKEAIERAREAKKALTSK